MKLFYLDEIGEKNFDIFDFKTWESQSLPLGNGYFGVGELSSGNIERLQITDNSLANPYRKSLDLENKSRNYGVQSFCDIFLNFHHSSIKEFKRELSLDKSLLTVSYNDDDNLIKREFFASYVDHILVGRITSTKPITFEGELKVPFVGNYCRVRGDGFSKTVIYDNDNDGVSFEGNMSYYNIDFVGEIKIKINNGTLEIRDNKFKISDSTECLIIFSCLTNYKLDESVFLIDEPTKKLKKDPYLVNKNKNIIAAAGKYDFINLYKRHLKDYRKLYSRVELSFGKEEELPTNLLLNNYKKGIYSSYLETLLFQYARYLLICSSRENGLPANLQGIWSAYDSSPWSDGYWHNINVQMNYWMVGPANLLECFIPYIKYNQAYFKKAHLLADDYIKTLYPDKYDENGNNGWIIGTGAWPYNIEGLKARNHSGPGMGALTSLLFYEYYRFTLDKHFLRKICYPIFKDMSIFLLKNLILIDGKYLINNSASPENIITGGNWNDYYVTTGCAFDQQMAYETFSKTIEISKILNVKDELFDDLNEVINNLDPVLIGEDGQIKEYREENHYGDIGEKHHRHISHLLGLYPGYVISNKKMWLKASETTLNYRGDESTGWAAAHRLCLWSRTKNSKRSMDLVHSFISNNILCNLWDSHPPFQIDGNFGYAAGVSEMLIQSHEGFIDLLPTLPKEWNSGYFKGLRARNGFVVDCKFKNSKIVKATILAEKDSSLVLKNKKFYYSSDGKLYKSVKSKLLRLKVKAGDKIYIKQ